MPSGKDILFLSDTLFDIDIGVIRYLQKYCNNSEFLDLDKLNSDDLFFVSYLMDDCVNNIIDSVIKEDYKESSESLYKEIIDTKYKEVIKLSPMTHLLDMIFAFKNAELNTGIVPVVVCKDQFEVDKIKEFNQNIECLITSTDSDIFNLNLNRFTRIFIRNIKDILKFDLENKLLGKSIVILSYRYNFELNNPIKILEEYTAISDVNIIESAIPYIGYTPPVG